MHLHTGPGSDRKRAGRADLAYRWRQDEAERLWEFRRGEGAEAVVERSISRELESDVLQLISETSKNGEVARRSCEVYQIAGVGWLCLTRVEGYGEENESTTQYAYDAVGNNISLNRSDGYWEEMSYDESGREIRNRKPWNNEDTILITESTYANSNEEAFDEKLYTRTQWLLLPDGSPMITLRYERYGYTDQEDGLIERTTVLTTGKAITGTRRTIEERWKDVAEAGRGRGQLRMRQEENGVQTWYSYENTTAHGAIYTLTKETRVEGELIPWQVVSRVETRPLSRLVLVRRLFTSYS